MGNNQSTKESINRYYTTEIAVQPQSKELVVNLEGTNLLLTVILSVAALLAILFKVISEFNRITSEIRDLKEDLKSHSSAKGHDLVAQEVENIEKTLIAFDKKIDLHLLDYVYYKDSVLLVHKGLGDNIKHNWSKTEKALLEQKAEVNQLQNFLHKKEDFEIRQQ